jgi:hypothetical protein
LQTLRRVGRRAVRVDATLEPLAWTLTLSAILSVGEEGRRTDALAWLHTLLVWPTVVISGALDLVGRTDPRVGVPGGPDRADTAEGANLVLAESSEAAGPRGRVTLVNVGTGPVRVDVESGGTGAVADSPGDGDAVSTHGAVTLVGAGGEDALAAILDIRRLAATVWSIKRLALHKGVSVVASGTLTVKTAREVLTEGIETAGRLLAQCALVHVPAQAGALPLEASLADTLALGAELAPWARLAG